MLAAVQDPESEQPAQTSFQTPALAPEPQQVVPQQEYIQHQPQAPQPTVQQPSPVAPPAAAQQYLPQQQPVQYAVPSVQQGTHVVQQPYAQPQHQQPPQPSAGTKKKNPPKTAFVQSLEDGERMRAGYLATRHLTGHRTLSDFIAYAVNEEVRRLEEQYNNGQRFAPDPAGIPRGRPVK
jgi:outer membrane biosynthesis protein TonB